MKKGIFASTKSAKERLKSGKYKPRCKDSSCACEPVKPAPATGNKDG